ncbi:MAG: peptidoglycan-binding protein [Magnetospirillum sp.]|nr:peptidoglycan-binding protein [Magnetospirillum sp.]
MGETKKTQMDQTTTRQVQQQLQQQGYDVGQVDGKWGQKSRQALMNFQRDQNMKATGSPDQQTMAALGVQADSQQAQTPSDLPSSNSLMPKLPMMERDRSEGGGTTGR